MIDHPDIQAAGIAAGSLISQAGAAARRLAEGGAISDAPPELARRGYDLDLSDSLTADYASGFEIEASAPFSRAAVVGFAMARISPVADTVRYRLVDAGADCDFLALDSAGATLAIWTIRGGGDRLPTSVSRQ